MIEDFTKQIIKDLRRDMNDLADVLANGRIQNIEDYRFTCGVIRGLAKAEGYILDLAKKAEGAEE